VKYFLRYFCAYCLSRMTYDFVRGLRRAAREKSKAAPAKPCPHGRFPAVVFILLCLLLLVLWGNALR
jgi:hypothetical protein